MFLPNEIQPGKFGVDLSSLYAHVSRNECSHTPATLRWKIPKIEVPSWKMNGEFIYPRLPGFGKPWWIRNISISKTEVPFPNLHFCCILDLSISQGFFMLTILIPPSFGCVNSQPPKHPDAAQGRWAWQGRSKPVPASSPQQRNEQCKKKILWHSIESWLVKSSLI